MSAMTAIEEIKVYLRPMSKLSMHGYRSASLDQMIKCK